MICPENSSIENAFNGQAELSAWWQHHPKYDFEILVFVKKK
jgi:hypothetical protein